MILGMNPIEILLLKAARKIVTGGRQNAHARDDPSPPVDLQGQRANDLIRKLLTADDPCMTTRIGSTEMSTLLRWWRQQNKSYLRNRYDYVTRREEAFWFDDKIKFSMKNSSGFFPCTDEALSRFADRYLRDLTQADVLGSWLKSEVKLAPYLAHAKTVPLQDLEPFFVSDPWTTALTGRNVLVIHPFEESIKSQYAKREVLFDDPRMLPAFTLKTLKAVQSIGEENPMGFETWFDALDWMCARVKETEFDVALIAAGAYGLPLAAYVKSLGKKAVHMGGVMQILFGIKGKRFDQREYQKFYNQHWTRPLAEETPGFVVFDGASGAEGEAEGQPNRAYW
jgi:hypothetical protein